MAEDVERALIDVRADIVVANPPYIPLESELPELVKDHEPHSALFGGAVDGFDIPRRFIAAATRILKPEGFLVIEHYEKQRAGLEAELGQDYRDITSYLDLNQRDRMITARKRP